MKLKQLKVAGFRGFNVEKTIQFHDRLTLVSASNSHGKTSITEALEFLIYGETSKVARAHSKDEFKDSYRNRHYPSSQAAVIELMCEHAEQGSMTLRVELDSSGAYRRFVNGSQVIEWPFAGQHVAIDTCKSNVLFTLSRNLGHYLRRCQ
jgi:recombinational DNA repair ATPase RecF